MSSVLPEAGPCIASVACAAPPLRIEQSRAKDFMMQHYAARLSPRLRQVMENLFSHPSIVRRSFAFEHPEELIDEPPDRRISRFTRWSIDLSAEAIREALAESGLAPADVRSLIVNTCTGYLCPGISTYLIERLGLERRVQAYDLVGSGCGGALPNLRLAEALLKEKRGGVVVSVSVEICSATFQMGEDLSLIVSNTLFGDGAAAAVLWNRPEGLALMDSTAYFAPEHREHIRYVYRDGALLNRLTSRLPQFVAAAAARVVADLLEPRGLSVADVRHWAIHTGGEKIIATIKAQLGLSEEQLGPTRAVLADYGNMSSPTVLFVLKELMDRGIETGEWCLMLAFGAGLSAHGSLLRML